MLLSKTGDYGLRAALYIASCSTEEFISIREISKKLNISFHFLTKILQKLTEKKLMISFRGPKGGVKLSQPPHTITLLDIVLALEGPNFFEKCILGLEQCSTDHPCPLHQQWVPLRKQLIELFETNTLATFISGFEKKQFRLRLDDKTST